MGGYVSLFELVARNSSDSVGVIAAADSVMVGRATSDRFSIRKELLDVIERQAAEINHLWE